MGVLDLEAGDFWLSLLDLWVWKVLTWEALALVFDEEIVIWTFPFLEEDDTPSNGAFDIFLIAPDVVVGSNLIIDLSCVEGRAASLFVEAKIDREESVAMEVMMTSSITERWKHCGLFPEVSEWRISLF